MGTVIKVEKLSKKYIISHRNRERYLTLRDAIAQKSREFGKRLLHPFISSSGQPLAGLPETEEFWALKDISFEVQQGDRLGIIGRNGAGKSTLLKILSRITEPTTGKIKIKGRVSSLLEVGTGFHPELTGRENIFLNGAILGMGKTEIKKKFDEIVAFAEVEKFLDTPVKRYSSGMYVRLAFAVAAHLEPEILVVDEVLAVGDLQFQKKCLGKMENVSSVDGRTVLFVSHNIGAIQKLCNKCMLLCNGQTVMYDETEKVIDADLSNDYDMVLMDINEMILSREKRPEVIIRSIDIGNGNNDSYISTGDTVNVCLEFEAFSQIYKPSFGVSFHTARDVEVIRLNTIPISGFIIDSIREKGKVQLIIDDFPLLGGSYHLSVTVRNPQGAVLVSYPNIVHFQVQDKDVYNSGKLLNNRKGLIKVKHKWELFSI